MLRADSSGVSTFAIWTLIRMANKGRVTQLLVLGIKLMPALARIAWQLGTARYRILEILCREYLPELLEVADQGRSMPYNRIYMPYNRI